MSMNLHNWFRGAAIVAVLSAGALFASSQSDAANLTWDSLGLSPTSPTDGGGTWDSTSPLWSNGVSDSLWINNGSATAVFGFGNGIGTAGTVTVATPISAAGIVFNTPHAGTYTIADSGGGNSITLGSGGITDNLNATGNTNTLVTISENIVLGSSSTISIAAGGGNNTYYLTGGSLTIGGAISDGGSGFGITLVSSKLDGVQAMNSGTYTTGTLTLTGANTYSGATVVQSGALNLNFSATGTQTNIVNAASALTIGSYSTSPAPYLTPGIGLLTINGVAGTVGSPTVNSQTFNGTNIGLGPNQIVVNSAANNTTNVALGAISRQTGGVVSFTLPAAGTISTSGTLSNGILGGWATIATVPGAGNSGSNDWATINGGNVVGLSTVAGGYTAITGAPTIASGAATNVKWSGSTGNATVAASATTDINSLLFSDATSRTVTFGAGAILRFGPQGGVMRSDTTQTATALTFGATTAAGGTITAGGPILDAIHDFPGEITFVANQNGTANANNNMVVNSTIANNPNPADPVHLPGAVTVIKTGRSSMVLNAASTYTGGTYIVQGRVSENNAAAFGLGPVYVEPGGFALIGSGTVSNVFYIAGGGDNDPQGALGAVRFNNGANLAGALNLIGDARVSVLDTGTSNTGTISGVISGNYNLYFGGTSATAITSLGTAVTLSNPANGWTGTTTINQGVVTMGTSSPAANGGPIPNGAGKGNVVIDSSPISSLNNAGAAVLNLNGRSVIINGLSSAGTATSDIVTGNMGTGAAANSTLTVGNNDASGVFAGIIQDKANSGAGLVAFTKMGAGKQTLSGANTYSGPTTISGGTLALVTATASNIGSSASISVAGGAMFDVTAVAPGSGGFALSGTQTLANNGTVAGNVTIGSSTTISGSGTYTSSVILNGGTVSPGNSIGTTTIQNNFTSAGGTLQIEFGGAASDQIQVTNAAAFTGPTTLAITLSSGATLPFYDILTAGSLSGAANLSFPSNQSTLVIGRTTFSFDPITFTGNKVRIDVAGVPANLIWSNAPPATGDGLTWDIQGTPANPSANKNWLNGANGDFYFDGDSVTFNDSNNGRYDVTLAANVAPSSVLVNNSSGDYNFTGAGISGAASLTKSGTRALTLSNINSYVGGTTLNDGKLNINSSGSIGTGRLTIAGGTIDNSSGGTITLTTNNLQTWAADVNFAGSSNLNLGTGAVTLSNLANGANRAINLAGNGTSLIIGGSISDSANGNNGLTISYTGNPSGSTILGLNGASTYTGATNLNSGVLLQVLNSASLGATAGGPVNIAAGAALDVGLAASDVLNFGQKQFFIAGDGISNGGTGSGALTDSAIGNQVLQENAFQKVTLTADASFGGSGLFDIRGVQVGGVNQAVLNLAGHTLTDNNTRYVGLVGVEVADGNIVVNSGTFDFETTTNALNFNSGKSITVNGGIVQFFNYTGTLTRPMTLNSGVTIGNDTNNTAVVGSNITLGGNVTVTAINGGGTGTLTLNGNIGETSPGSGSITKNNNGAGTSTLILAGNNTFTGGLTINGGVVQLNSAGALNSTSPNIIGFSGSGPAGTKLRLNGNSVTVAGLSGGGGATPGVVENNNATPATLTINSNSSLSFDGILQDGAAIGGKLSLTLAGSGTLVLTNANTYTGGTIINGGTLQLGNGGVSGSIAGTSSIGGSGGTLDFNRTDDFTFAQSIGGSIGLAKDGPNTVTLSAANTYSGATNINGGALAVTGSLAANSAVHVSSSATLSGTGDGITTGRAGSVTLDSASSVRPGLSPVDGNIGLLAMNSLSVNGGDFRMDIVNTTSGDRVLVTNSAAFAPGSSTTFTPVFPTTPLAGDYTLINAGSVSVGSGATLLSGLPANTRLTSSVTATSTAVLLHISGAIGNLTWTGAQSSDWDLNSHSNWKIGATPNQKYFDLDAVTFDDSSSASTHNVALNASLSPSSVTVAANTNYTIGGSGEIAGSGGLTKSGTGTLTLATNNTYHGATAVQNGTLVLGASNALPAGTSLTLGSGSTSGVVDLNGNSIVVSGLATSGAGAGNIVGSSTNSSSITVTGGASTFAGVIQDNLVLPSAGQQTSLTVSGGSLTLAGNNTYTGPTMVSTGATLQLGNGGTSGSIGASSLTLDGTLAFNRIDAVTISSSIFGQGSLQQLGTGTLTLTASNLYAGTTTINSGTLQVGDGINSSNLGNGNITDNGILAFNVPSVNTTIAQSITGTGQVQQLGPNTLTLSSANNNFAGGLLVSNGAVRLTALAAGGTGTITANTGGTVVFASGAVSFSNPIILGGGTLGSTGAPVLTSSSLTAAAGTTSTIVISDPQNPNTVSDTVIGGTLHGSGNINVYVGTPTGANNPSPDGSGAGFRLRGTQPSDFSGIITIGNSIKGELQTSVAGPFSPAGSGTIVLSAGTTTGGTNGTYSILYLRNNSAGSSVIGTNVVVAGPGFTSLSLPGSAPAGSVTTMGNLQIGGGQILGMNSGLNTANISVAFQSVTLTGGNATFSPKSTLNGTNTSIFNGSANLTLGAIGESVAGSGIVVDGLATVFLNGASNYTGPTAVNRGTLQLAAADVIPNTSNLSLGTGGLSPTSVPTFATGGLSETLGSLTVGSDGGKIDFGSGASILHFADSSASVWNTAMTIANWTAFSDHLFFGANSAALSATQLTQINYTGHLAGARFSTLGEVVPNPYLIKGDFNQDGVENINDTGAMLQALTDVKNYQNTYGLTNGELATIADFDSDGVLTNRDIQRVLDALAGSGSVASVPEPSSALLAGLGVFFFGLLRVKSHKRSRAA